MFQDFELVFRFLRTKVSVSKVSRNHGFTIFSFQCLEVFSNKCLKESSF
jgi:hypothetical protein